jgi:hypothetical protein
MEQLLKCLGNPRRTNECKIEHNNLRENLLVQEGNDFEMLVLLELSTLRR